MYTCQRQHLARHLLDSCPYRESQHSQEEDGESAIFNDDDSKENMQDGVRVELLRILHCVNLLPVRINPIALPRNNHTLPLPCRHWALKNGLVQQTV
jgi:hypothetical protein